LAIKSIDVPALPTMGPAASVSLVTEPSVTAGMVASAGPPGFEPPILIRGADLVDPPGFVEPVGPDLEQAFIENLLAEYKPAMVLDVGCNTGFFSAIAARSGASVVAIDYDPVVVGSVWRNASDEDLDILPLVVNITRPSPSIGWRNLECPSFLERAQGRFDAVFMLAVIHHMLVTERIPLDEIIDLVADITTDILVIEYVSPDDSMFRRLTRGRDSLFSYLSTDVFEKACSRYFNIVRVQHLDNTERWLYFLRKKVSLK
jgi:ribosomal protein L11 methylase PrmA